MSHSERGFTLVELLVAMVLLAFLTAMLAGGLDLATRRYQGQYSRLEQSQRLVVVQTFLRAQLSDARAIPDRSRPDGAIAFEGAPRQVRFVATGPASVNVSGLADITVEFEPGSNQKGGKLVVFWRSFRPGDGGTPRESLLLDHVRRADFAYFGRAKANEPADWYGEWSRSAGLPSLMRLSVTFDDGSIMPDLVVAVETAASPGG